ncbi:SH3 domain-containing protein [Jiella pelagia]|uniref:SH3 domain-containing protein n=1 Tax=Jiella pelagia TaxID=2986949 RepID=A0ABY7C7U5_9HYPH|nr:SH3 domain-containing protein [Jiella pelagia]WAP69875.1 SH3 domain-containing protein [Jiella pelagia]
MRKTLLAAAALAGVLAASTGSASASEWAIATADVNVRAGPSTDYPVIDTARGGERLRVFGCLQTRSWCDVRFQGQRGWMSANYIATRGDAYDGRRDYDPYSAPVISFSIDSYWGDHYRSRNFYRDRDRFRGHRDRDRGDRGRDRDWDGRGHDRDWGDRRHGGRDRDRHRDGRDRDFGDRDGHRGGRDYDRRRGDDRAGFDGRGRHDGRRGGPDRRGPGDVRGPGHDGGLRNDAPPRPLYRVD